MSFFIASIDIGYKNFAFVIEEITEPLEDFKTMSDVIKGCKTILLKNIDVINFTSDPDSNSEKKAKTGFAKYCEKEKGRVEDCFPYLSVKDIKAKLKAEWTKLSKKDKKSYSTAVTTLSQDFFCKLNTVLDTYKEYFDICKYIVIEQQMSFFKKINIKAIKIAQHCLSYFTFHYHNFKKVIDFPAYHKYKVFNAPKLKKEKLKKEWAPQKAKEIWTLRKDLISLEELKKDRKADDKADVLLQALAFIYLESQKIDRN